MTRLPSRPSVGPQEVPVEVPAAAGAGGGGEGGSLMALLQALRESSSDIAHDMKNPLNGVLALSQNVLQVGVGGVWERVRAHLSGGEGGSGAVGWCG